MPFVLRSMLCLELDIRKTGADYHKEALLLLELDNNATEGDD